VLVYRVPPEKEVEPGDLVAIPLGKGWATGVVVPGEPREGIEGIKPLRDILKKGMLYPPLLDLALFMAERYCCPLPLVLDAFLPPGLGENWETLWCWLPSDPAETRAALETAASLFPESLKMLEYLSSQGRVKEKELKRKAPAREGLKALDFLESHHIARKEWQWLPPFKAPLQEWVYPTGEGEALLEKIKKRAPRQARILKEILEKGPQPRSVLASQGGSQALKRLESLGLVEIKPFPPENPGGKAEDIQLDGFQAGAAEKILRYLGRGGVFLLYGVTGSGKTEVYLYCAAQAISRGYQVLYLVPERALIPQTLRRLQERLDVPTEIIHGDLPSGERVRAWERARWGEVGIVVGTRAALFTPLPRLGLIIVDEEHVSSYKQDHTPRYDAREVAIKRGQLEKATVVFGSATPSTEIFYLAQRGLLTLLELPQRFGGLSLPQVEVVDLRQEFAQGHYGLLSRALRKEIEVALAEGRQAILFLNRRGYAPYLVCRFCGYVPLCDHCSVALTYHGDGWLRCHYCGYARRAEDRCPRCGGKVLKVGAGTQRLEEEVKSLWPQARILRADKDTTSRKGEWQEIYSAFLQGQADILIGTQLVAKGLDFPGVKVVGIINADLSLYQPDFRSRERTFQILTQVAGRAGRREISGKVLVQTHNPWDPAIALAITQDYYRFYQEEIKIRRRLCYPPFCKLVRIGFTGREDSKVLEVAQEAARLLKEGLSEGEVLGPAPAYPWRLKSNYRWQLTLKLPSWEGHREKVKEVLQLLGRQEGVNVIIDVGPVNPW